MINEERKQIIYIDFSTQRVHTSLRRKNVLIVCIYARRIIPINCLLLTSDSKLMSIGSLKQTERQNFFRGGGAISLEPDLGRGKGEFAPGARF